MNKIKRIVTSALAAAVLLSGSAVTAGAVQTCEPQVYVIGGCNFGSCQDWKNFLENNCYQLQQFCQNICVDACAPAEQPSAPAEQPAAETTAPAVQPTQPQPTQPPAAETTAPSVQLQQPAGSAYNEAYEDEVIRLVNIERANYGLAALSKRADATAAAEIRAKEIVQSFSHTRPNGTSCFTVCGELGISYRSVGENIAYGQRTPQQVVNGWMNSEGHRKNILSASFTSIGVGCYQQGNTLYWSQL